MLTAESPFAAAGDVLATEVFGYSILQLAIGGLAIAGVIGGVRWAFGKAFEKA